MSEQRMPKIIILRKHAYPNILNILQPKNENFQIKKSDIFHISAQNIDCGYSLEHQSLVFPDPTEPENSGAFNISVFKDLEQHTNWTG